MEKELARFLLRYIGIHKLDIRNDSGIILTAASAFMNRRFWIIKD